jgi:spermidine synthase
MSRELRSSLAIGVAVFVAGGALLGLEIASSRVLAPHFGNSLYVWGSLIGIVLAGLSTGYWLGGIVADRYPTPRLLVGLLGTGALLVLAIPFVDGWMLDRVVEWDPGPRSNPVLATILLFGLPSVVLGTVSPVAVRLKARSIEKLGRTAGRLFAVSTAGSIAGTFLTSFWLIPALGTDQVLASAAVALVLAAAAVALVEKLLVAFALALALAGASVGAVVSLAPEQGGTVAASQLRNWSPVYRQQSPGDRVGGIEETQSGYKVLHTSDSQYHRIAVVEDDTSRYLRFDSSFQSGMYVDEPFRTRFEYSDYLQLPLAYRAQTRRILYIGLGGGSAPKRTWRDFPGVRIDAVELDPEVVEVAYKYFELPRDPRLRVEVDDGRRYVADNDGPWDVIVVDAFYSDSIPFHLATREFLELARSRLSPGGLVVTNIIGAVRGPDSRLFRSMLRTYRAVFPTVAVHPVRDGGNDLESVRNIIVVAGDGAAPSKEFLLERWREVRRRSPAAPDLKDAIEGRVDAPISTQDVPVLTDDYAPTDALLLLFD